jgi:threonine dehydratase
MCDGVAVPYITDEMFPLLRELVDEVVLVAEERVRETIRSLALGNRLIVEASAALPVAAALDRGHSPGGSVPTGGGVPKVCVVTGASIDREKLVEILG